MAAQYLVLKRFHWTVSLLLGAWLSLAAPLYAKESIQSFDRAFESYLAGNYSEAIKIYQQALSQGYENSSLYFNLGNSFYKDDKRGMALGAYFRAYELEPRSQDIRYNIEYLLRENRDSIPWQSPVGSLSLYGIVNLKELLYATGICIGLFGFFWGLSLLGRGPRSVFTALATVFLLGGLYGSTILVLAPSLWPLWGAVASSEEVASVYSAPSEASGVVIFKLSEGTPLMVKSSEAAWYRIQLSDKKQGWLPAAQVAVFGPRRPSSELMSSLEQQL